MKKILLLLAIVFSINYIQSQDVNIEEFATGFSSPVNIQHHGSSQLYIVERDGIIKIVDLNGVVNATPFLNISSIVQSGGEQGLLGLAFHPDYASNGYFFVNYIKSGGDTVIARYSVSGDPDVADASSAEVLLTIDQPAGNHNGGSIVFGPDGYLYIGMGDGGGAGDTDNNAQNTQKLLGKMLRLNVDISSPYIPTDNPFVNDSSVKDEIWAIGVRNPWKFSFDALNGDLWIADVGQGSLEEINHNTIDESSGLNYGWRCYEGNNGYNTSGCSDISNYEFPVAEYSHSWGRCSITGGFVYRGTQYPDFYGLYFFADYCTSEIGTVDPNNGNQVIFNGPFTGRFSSFGEDSLGNLYVAGLSNGKIYKIIDDTLSNDDNTIDNVISIYPNPTKDSINISTKSLQNIIKITVYDLLGKMVIDKTINNLSTFKLSVKNLKQGVYVVKTKTENNKTYLNKISIK